MEKENVLSNLWGLRAGLSIISQERDKVVKCNESAERYSSALQESKEKVNKIEKQIRNIKNASKKNAFERVNYRSYSFGKNFLIPLLACAWWVLLFGLCAIIPLGIGSFLFFWVLPLVAAKLALIHISFLLVPFYILIPVGAGFLIYFCYSRFGEYLIDKIKWSCFDFETPKSIRRYNDDAIENEQEQARKQEEKLKKLQSNLEITQKEVQSAETKLPQQKEKALQLTDTALYMCKSLENQYKDLLDIRDWKHLDLIIFYFETGRADSLKEALQLVDRQVQTDSIVNAVYTACSEICDTIKINTDRLGHLIGQGMITLSNQLVNLSTQMSDLHSYQIKQVNALLETQNALVALQEKSNRNSMQLMEDCRYLATLAEQNEIRRRNNA